MAEICKHRKRHPENAMWPDEDALEHFLECLTPEQQLELWTSVRKYADLGTVCQMMDHRSHLARTLEELAFLRTAIQEAIQQFEASSLPGLQILAGGLRKLLDGEKS